MVNLTSSTLVVSMDNENSRKVASSAEGMDTVKSMFSLGVPVKVEPGPPLICWIRSFSLPPMTTSSLDAPSMTLAQGVVGTPGVVAVVGGAVGTVGVVLAIGVVGSIMETVVLNTMLENNRLF